MNNGALEGSNEFSILSPNKQTEVLLTNQQSNGFSIPLLFNRMKPEADFQSLTMPKMTPNFSANRQISTSPVQLYNRRSESPLKNVTSRTSRFDNAGESFTNRLSKGLVDFTQGSSYRLQKWKNKLQNGRKQKDSSEPPPVFRFLLL
ncbi:unnamed protein product [Dracunculus medinensis]|uniref:Uncharacterized protein n=1 Tax=Dracunculus medinensis TaxID=318479 RepID=A0A0N4UNC2_DRAME|nr:unnamed protein product [Dracunculus medinensis]